MAFLVILERELRVAARRPGTHWTRFGIAFIGVLVGAWLLISGSRRGFGPAVGSGLAVFSQIFFLYFVFRGVTLTADAVSRERREGTLGLLFLTNLKAHGIILGKLSAALVTGVSALLALFPVLAIGLVSGGIGGLAFFRVALALATALFLALAVGMFMSVCGREQRRSESNAALVMLFFWLGLPVLDEMLQRSLLNWPPVSLRLLSPAYLHGVAATPMAGGPTDFYWRSLLVNYGEIALILMLANWRLDRTWRDPLSNTGMASTGSKSKGRVQRTLANPVRRQKLRDRAMSINPYYWLAARRKWRSGRVWLVLTVICGVAALIASGLTDPTQFAPATLFFVLIGWHLMIKLLVADEMGRTLSADRASGALEFVLSTPLSVQEIVRGEWLALWKVFRWPVAIFLALAAGGLVMILTRTAPQWIGNYSVANITLLLTTCITLFGLDIIALGWVGIWMTMRHRKREHAPGSAVARVMALPSLIFLLLTIAWSGSDWFLPGANSNHAFLVNVAWWFAIGVAVDISFIWWSRRQLFRHFRVMATLEYANLGFGAWWGRRLGTAYARWRRARSNMPKQSAPC